MSRAGEWWRRAAAAIKDRRSLCLSRLTFRRPSGSPPPPLHAALIRATSHDERSLDYTSAALVFSFARASPSSLLRRLVSSLSRRASRTRSWPVALKSLLVLHGLLFSSPSSAATIGRIPFDLSDFRDRSSPAFSAFVRAYFRFLDLRSISFYLNPSDLADLESMQDLLDLALQIRPCSDGMSVGLVLETMDCVLIEIFEIYSGICTGVATFLAGFAGSKRRRTTADGEKGIRVLRRAGDQSGRLAEFFEVCKGLGVNNALELPALERIPEEDVADLERLVIGDGGNAGGADETERKKKKDSLGTVVTREWVKFDEEGYFGESPGDNRQITVMGDLIQWD